MARPFGLVASSIWRSKKFRALPSDADRLAYLYLHTTPHGNSIGAFVLPPELANLELRSTPDAVNSSFEALHRVGLIRYDASEELVQIRNFFTFNSFSSRKHFAGSWKVFNSLPDCRLKEMVACDIVVSLFNRATSWEGKVEANDARGQFLNDAAQIIKTRRLQTLICSPELGISIDVLIPLSEQVLIPLPIQQRQETETETQTERNTDTETETQTDIETAGISKIGRSASEPPASPAGGSRAARNTPEDVAAIIKGLGAGKRV